jgi:hypothetical protein
VDVNCCALKPTFILPVALSDLRPVIIIQLPLLQCSYISHSQLSSIARFPSCHAKCVGGYMNIDAERFAAAAAVVTLAPRTEGRRRLHNEELHNF